MGHLALERLDQHDLPAVQALFRACKECFVATTGRPAPLDAAHSLYMDLPASVMRADKHLLGVCDTQTRELMGLIDAICGHPEPGTLTVGLFLLSPCCAEGTLMQKACRLLEAWAEQRGLLRLRIAVHAVSVPRLDLWRQAGFVPDGEPVRRGRQLVVVVAKSLSATDEGPLPLRDSPKAPRKSTFGHSAFGA